MTDTLTAERELDALICDFQAACEECVERSNSETMMERAILRNALRSKLLAATARITALEAALRDVIEPGCECDKCCIARDVLHEPRTARSAT